MEKPYVSEDHVEPFIVDSGNRAEFERAWVVAKSDPGELTDHDIRLLASASQASARLAVVERRKLREGPSIDSLFDQSIGWCKDRDSGHSTRALVGLAFNMLQSLTGHFTKHRKELQERLDALTIRVAAIEAQGTIDRAVVKRLEERPQSLVYRGVWDPGLRYSQGDVVTHSGGMWSARVSNVGQKPNEQHQAWQLCVKAGHNRRDDSSRSHSGLR